MWHHKLPGPRCTRHLLVASLVLWLTRTCLSQEIADFLSVNTLPDGEVETRIYYKGTAAKETSVARGSSVKFRQLVFNHHLIQLIYSPEDQLIDCEYLHNANQSKSFLLSFKRETHDVISTTNASVVPLDGKNLPEQLRWANWIQLRKKCQLRHKEIKEEARRRKEAMNNQRSKRELSDMFLVPGTKWCGKGYSADKYTKLGGFSRTDKCCRKHDLACPFWIGGFETKYGLFNWRINTIMHCNCDLRFRACLKRVGTSDANLVGKLFFNVVQTKCFILKPRRKCVRWSWWGKCEKFKMIKQAILRDNLSY